MGKVDKWDLETDVVVVGSGGAGLTAALTAKDHGCATVIIERTDKIGGTTSVSGGALWIPNNHLMQEDKIKDSRQEALNYCKKMASGRYDNELIETFVDVSNEMLEYVEEKTNLTFTRQSMPDYQPELDGGKAEGRGIEPKGVVVGEIGLGEWVEKLREPPLWFLPLSNEEIFRTFSAALKPQNLPVDLMNERFEKGMVFGGKALIAHLMKGCIDKNVDILLETRGRELICEDGKVIGLRAEKNGKDFYVKASCGVVLACGGIEWNEKLKANLIPGPLTHPHTPPYNEGDGLIMAAKIGAQLANTGEAWWFPATAVPDEEYEGKPLSHFCFAERLCPHTILVNKYGKRFVNEAANYSDMGKAFSHFDTNNYGYKNLPCWAVFDSQYRENYMVITVLPGDPDPEWLAKDETLEGLAKKVGIDSKGLSETIKRFNRFVEDGKDSDFGRGDQIYDRWIGDQQAPHPNLGKIEKPPFYALPIYSGALGTKGGPLTNKEGNVLDVFGNRIEGLYAAGNAMAMISGPGYYGPGGTISIGMTWGYICGKSLSKKLKSN